MRLEIVSHHLPALEGTAAGRVLWATCSGLLAAGHDVHVTSWAPAPAGGDGAGDVPPWCTWTPFDARARRHRSLVTPRRETEALSVVVGDDTVVVADDWLSFPAITRHPGPRVLTLHHLPWLDARSPAALQDRRAVRRAVREATGVLAYSSRVAAAAPRSPAAAVVPIAVPFPADAVPPVDAPVVAVVADWRWPPNDRARRRLLDAWPAVRARIPSARLVVAGRGLATESGGDGIEIRGEVGRALDVLAEAAVVAFPSPPTSGPKVKVLEAMAAGVTVVTTPAGVEGIVDPAGAVVTAVERFADTLAATLADPARRETTARAGRAAIEHDHAPLPAARARVSALAPARP